MGEKYSSGAKNFAFCIIMRFMDPSFEDIPIFLMNWSDFSALRVSEDIKEGFQIDLKEEMLK